MLFDNELIVSELPSGTARETDPFRVAEYMMRLPHPCLGCANYVRCADYQLACRSFSAFVRSGTISEPTEPSREIYDRIFSGEED